MARLASNIPLGESERIPFRGAKTQPTDIKAAENLGEEAQAVGDKAKRFVENQRQSAGQQELNDIESGVSPYQRMNAKHGALIRTVTHPGIEGE